MSGVAPRGSECSDHKKKQPARYCDGDQGRASRHARDLEPRDRSALAGCCQTAALALRLIPDLLDEALVALDAELNDDIDQQIEQALDVAARAAPGPPRLCLTRSTSCSKASSALARGRS